jgi:hypothetical protein
MADNGKEYDFGGLPNDLFNGVVVFLQGRVSAGLAAGATATDTAAAGPAVSALASLAKSEHAAAASTVQVRQIDVVFKAIDLQKDLAALSAAPAATLPAALGAFQGKLDKLTDFWNGK